MHQRVNNEFVYGEGEFFLQRRANHRISRFFVASTEQKEVGIVQDVLKADVDSVDDGRSPKVDA